MLRTVLVTMPFAAVEYPSLALGLFKARFRQEGMPCDVQYLNVTFAEMIGWLEYNRLIVHPPALFSAEQVFAHSLFGDLIPSDATYCADAHMCSSLQQQLYQTKSLVGPFLQRCLDTVDWEQYDIIGFTSLFEQNLASLSLAYQLKQRYPNKILVFGGPNFEGPMGLALHRTLPFIDFVCSGEADYVFPELVKRLSFNHPVDDLRGIVYRKLGRSIYTGAAQLIRRMDELPLPDYDDFFERIRNSPLAPSVEPCVLLETSRGCWWGEKQHCTFCGLNGQGMAYRSKSADRSLTEILYLLDRHKVRFIRVVDNILDYQYFHDLLPELARRKLETNIFFEVKANLRKSQVRMLADAGVTIVQAGIESLSTNTLRLMRKGTKSLMNIQTLRWCKQLGVQCDWNVLYGFPGEVPEDYRRSAELATLLTHLDPPTGCGPIRLDRFSPNYDQSELMGLTNVRPMKAYRYLYPFDTDTLRDVAYYFDFDYKQTIDDGGCRDPLNEAVWVWQQRKDQFYGVDQGDTLVLADTRQVARQPQIVLNGAARDVYEYCDAIRSRAQIDERLAARGEHPGQEQVNTILDDLVDRKLMVREGQTHLSLALMNHVAAAD
jgi:ribosomal peptide maturation radical SAM protein 1